MYKIMLADDEGIVIESLKFMIEKELGNNCERKWINFQNYLFGKINEETFIHIGPLDVHPVVQYDGWIA